MSGVRRAALTEGNPCGTRTAQSTEWSERSSRTSVTPFPGKGDGGMAP
jgi:hypothetical protein